MEEIFNAFFILSAELFGMLPWYKEVHKQKGQAKDTIDKRNEFLMPLMSVIISILTIICCKGLQEILKLICDIFDESSRDGLIKIFSWFDPVTITSIYCFFYNIEKKKYFEKIIRLGEALNVRFDLHINAYILDEKTRKYKLSQGGIYAKKVVFAIASVDLILLAIGYQFSPNSNLIDFEILDLIPMVMFCMLMETYLYLNGEKEAGNVTDCIIVGNWRESLDLVKIRAYTQGYAQKNGICVMSDLIRHQVGIRLEMGQVLQKNQSSEDPYVHYLIHYLENKKRSDRLYSSQCIDAVVKLVKKENVFYATPFYKDLDVCIFFPIYLALLRREKALVILEDSGNLAQIVAWIKKGVEEIDDLVDLWNVGILDEDAEEVDVGILSFQDIHCGEKLKSLNAFFHKVSFVVIIEASDFLAGGQEAVSSFSSKIGTDTEGCTWLLCDRNAESMLDLFSHLLSAEFTYVSATPERAKETLVFYWDTETEPAQIWKPVKRYLGIEAGILEIAKQNGVFAVSWYGEELMPVIDLKWIMGQYYLQYGERTAQKPHQLWINEQLICDISGISCELDSEKYMIIEDSGYNLYEAARQYATRGSTKAVVHIMSPNYMLRDFMKSQEESMKADSKYIAQLVPEYINSKRNIALRLIRRMLEEPVSESEAENLLKGIEEALEPMSWLKRIRKLVNIALNCDSVNIIVTYHNLFSPELGIVGKEAYYQIMDSHVKNEFNRYFQQASYIDEEGNRKHISKLILAGHLEQKYLPGQYVTLNGKYYEVTGYLKNELEYVLQVRRASDQIMGRYYYRQQRAYRALEIKEDPSYKSVVLSPNKLCLKRCEADITAFTYGYVEMKKWNDLENGKNIVYDNPLEKERSYMEKQMLKIEFIDLPKEDKKLVCWLGVLLHETFCTFYPQYYHLLSVALDRKKYWGVLPDKIMMTILSNIETDKKKDDYCFYILEDSREDMGLLQSIENHFQQILDILREYVEWSKDTGNDYLNFGVDGHG